MYHFIASYLLNIIKETNGYFFLSTEEGHMGCSLKLVTEYLMKQLADLKGCCHKVNPRQ